MQCVGRAVRELACNFRQRRDHDLRGRREARTFTVGDGDVDFASLRVKGLPMYAYPFHVSRYTSFAEHIGSFGGTVLAVTADDMGNGATTRDVPGLWAESSQEIAEAMQPPAGAED